MNLDFKNGFENGSKDNNEKSCSWSRNRVSHKINFKPLWPRNGHAASIRVNHNMNLKSWLFYHIYNNEISDIVSLPCLDCPMDLFSWPRNPRLKSRDRIKMCRAVPSRIHGWLNLDGWIFVFLDRLMSDAAWHLYHPALASLSIKQTWFSIMIINSTKTTRVFLTKLFK